MTKQYIRHGIGSVRPYLYGKLDLPALIKFAFGAVELERYDYSDDEFHVEAQIGDSVVVLEICDRPQEHATQASVYVYVEDVDACYKRALEHGATAVAEPQDKPYSERSAGVKDLFGNTWWISTFTADS